MSVSKVIAHFAFFVNIFRNLKATNDFFCYDDDKSIVYSNDLNSRYTNYSLTNLFDCAMQ